MIHRCLIIDDEPLARDLLKTHLSELDNFELVASCSSAIEASQILSMSKIDLIFLDIEMPVLKGIDFYKGLLHKPHVIFTTAYRDYAVDGFNLNAVDYLLKPITFARFFEAIEKYLKSFQPDAEENITLPTNTIKNKKPFFVRADRKEVLLKPEEVLYIKSLKDYVEIYTKGKKLTVKNTLSNIVEELGSNFIRVHRSYSVNIENISAYTTHDVEIGDIEIPIGESYKANFLNRINK